MEHTEEATIPLARATQLLLRSGRLGRSMRGFDAVTSTNTVAAAWAVAGAPEGAVVVAERQTSGRGRFGRSWESGSGIDLTFSIVLRPDLPPSRLGLVSVAAGLAVAEVVAEEVAPASTSIKWPNDVLIGGRKCCGMLLESTIPPPAAVERPTIVLGIGLNVNSDAFSPDVSSTATSLLLETGRFHARPDLLARLIERIEYRYDMLLDARDQEIREAYLQRLAGVGQEIEVASTLSGSRFRGVIEDIDPSGALVLRTDEGLQEVHAGEVTTQFHST
jgi:BirA family transcriptional regulator, biotin operon repressor / biotin---[acetyl-CoA-carboxylase] ligase